MITFKEYLNEQSSAIGKIVEIIHQDCLPFLKEIGDKLPIYHGSNNIVKTMQKIPLTKNKKPSYMSREVHDLLDSSFEMLSGVKFTSSGISTTGSRKMAYQIGNVHLFFPVGKYNYAWSPLVNDANEYFGLKAASGVVEDGHIEYDSENVDKYYDAVHEFIMSGGAQYKFNTGLQEAAQSGHEILFNCDEYYLIHSPLDKDYFITDLILYLRAMSKRA